MLQRKKFDQALNDILERVLKGERLEDCLLDYPREAEEIRPLVKLAFQVKDYAGSAELSPEFKTKVRAEIEEAFWARQRSRRLRVGRRLKPVLHWAGVTLGIVVIIISSFVAGFALSSLASGDTMPGDTFYPAKLATEKIRVALTFSDTEKVELLSQLAETRAEEIAYALEEGKAAEAEVCLKTLEKHLKEVEGICIKIARSETPVVVADGKQESQLEKIGATLESSRSRAIAKLKKTSTQDYKAKEEIISRIEESYSKALEAARAAK